MVCCICFPSTANVLTTNGYVAVADLKPKHKLLSVQKNGVLKRTGFYSYLHYDPELVANFLILKCDNNFELTISGNHLLFRMENGQPQAVLAKDISVGDSLVFVNHDETICNPKITEIQSKYLKGVFAPLSGKGTLIVDGFQTSCYAEIRSHRLAHACMSLLRLWHQSGKLVKPSGTKGDGSVKEFDKIKHIHPYAKALIAFESALPFTCSEFGNK